MAKTNMENLRLGIFVVIGSVLLLFAAYLIGNRQSMFGNTFEISAVFKNTTGLQNGNNVRFSGIIVGTVNDMEMLNDTTIRVRMIIQDEMRQHIKKNAIASISSDGLVGSMLVNIIPGVGSSTPINSGDVLQSHSKVGTLDMMSTLSVTNENAAVLTEDLLNVTQSLTEGKGTLGRLLNDTLMANDLQRTLLHLKHMSEKADATMAELNLIVSRLDIEKSAAGIFLADTVSGRKMKNIVQNLEIASEEIGKTTQNLSTLTAGVIDGGGAFNYLSNDTVLVKQLNRTMQNIEQGTERFNENMEALKYNFLTRRYFRKLEKERKIKQ